MIKHIDGQQLSENDNRSLLGRLADFISNLFRRKVDSSTYVIGRLPINEHQVYRRLFPRKGIVDEPETLVQRRLVVIFTRFKHIGYFQDLARLLSNKGIGCGVITELPLSLAEEDLELLQSFSFCFFHDDYNLSAYPFDREAAEVALGMVNRSDLSSLPRLGSLGYLELRVDEDRLPCALLALSSGKESFTFCERIAKEARKQLQFKSLVSCPRYLEVKVQEALTNAVIQDDPSDTIRVARIYWLTNEQLAEQLEQSKPAAMLGSGESTATTEKEAASC